MQYLIVKEQHRKGEFEIQKGKYGSIEVFTNTDVPMMGMITTEKPESGFNFCITCCNKDSRVIGSFSFDFSMMKNETLVMLDFPIRGISSNTDVASITLKICWILPYQVNKDSQGQDLLTKSEISYDFPKWFLIGHRGSGSNKLSKEYLENSFISGEKAINNGADFIEFDIQMTKDGIPVIYHDFHLKSEKLIDTLGEPAKIDDKGNFLYAVKQFTKDEFVKTGLDTIYQTERATFEDFLTKLPQSVGFDVEIKYPCFKKLNNTVFYYEINKFVDCVLNEMARLAGNKRRIFFSSFDPIIVSMLKLKQKKWPVFQLYWMTPKESLQEMTKKVKSYSAIHQQLGVEGFVGDSKPTLQVPNLIKEISDMGFIFCTYGDPNNNTREGIEKQLQLGVRGICTDDVPQAKTAIDEFKKINEI